MTNIEYFNNLVNQNIILDFISKTKNLINISLIIFVKYDL